MLTKILQNNTANDLQKYTDMTMSTVTQRQSIYYNGSFNLLRYMVSQVKSID